MIRAAVLAVVALAVLAGCDSAQRHAPSAHDSRGYPPATDTASRKHRSNYEPGVHISGHVDVGVSKTF